MPAIDSRYCGRPYRYGYSAGFIEPGANFQTLFRYDWQTRQRHTYAPGPGYFTQEPVFIPRAADAAEGDGYLLSLIYDVANDRSDLVVLSASDLSAGPIARIKLPHRTGSGLHGAWVAA
jgi:carotenoid cleavage dioxygenase